MFANDKNIDNLQQLLAELKKYAELQKDYVKLHLVEMFTEVARMAYANVKGEQANHLMRKIPYTIIPGEEGKLRKDIFLERAIVEERVRLAMGLPTRRMDEHNSVVSGLEDAYHAGEY